jgi:hypothetical protein
MRREKSWGDAACTSDIRRMHILVDILEVWLETTLKGKTDIRLLYCVGSLPVLVR